MLLSCVTNDTLKNVKENFPEDDQQESLANAVRNAPCVWPSHRVFGIGMFYGEHLSEDNWIPVHLVTSIHLLNVSKY